MIKVNFPTGLFRLLLGSAIGASADMIKLRLAISYLKLVKSSRQMIMQMSLLIFCLVILAFGLVMIPISLCLFMPWTAAVKAIVALSFGGLYILVPLIVLMMAFSESRWLGASNIDKLINTSK